jgi:hypothetical protein
MLNDSVPNKMQNRFQNVHILAFLRQHLHFLSDKFLELVPLFARKNQCAIDGHNIGVYLSDLTTFLGKTAVINCLLT